MGPIAETNPGLLKRVFSAENATRNKEILAGGLAGISAFSKISAGAAEAAGLSAQAGEFGFLAQQQGLLAEQQETLGIQQVAVLMEEFGAQEASLQVALNSAGISGGATVDATFVQHEKGRERAIEASELDTRTQVLSTKQARLSSLRTARALRSAAKSAKRAGKFGAFGDIVGFLGKGLLRG